ncbi:hypothetical protein [Vulcanisaeta distributa]|uniref:hypothetical protein n=1 Tax=Vulcanisaeta distributa TaxID=164451 RepID=UPI001FB21FAC|nr:hypothetical protein [Vulcanisaeta distributa]
MGSRSGLLLIIAVFVVAIAVISFVVRYFLIPRHFLPSYVMPKAIDYGFLYCNNHFIVIPGNSMVILRYHVHGNVTINGVVIYMAFPADLINASLNAFSRLPNPSDAMMLGVYVNGKLIAVNNDSSPILGLKTSVSIPYHYGNETVTFWQLLSLRNETYALVEYTSYGIASQQST